MSTPKPGDRVRVTLEGVWQNSPYNSDGFSLRLAHTGIGPDDLADALEIEVVASPVYTNSDTTEYRFADVAKDAGGNTLFREERGWRWCAFDGDGPRAPMQPLTLLVRDGKPVQP